MEVRKKGGMGERGGVEEGEEVGKEGGLEGLLHW